MLRPVVYVVLQFFNNIGSAVDGCGEKHPALFCLCAQSKPFVKQFVDIDSQFFFVQFGCQSLRIFVYAAFRHGGIAQ
jgi:hypothetical protein